MSSTTAHPKIDFSVYLKILRGLDNLPMGAILIKDSLIYYVNRKLLDLFQYADKSELLGTMVENLRPEKLRKKLAKRASRREQGIPQPENYISMGRLQDGSYKPIQVNATRFEIEGNGFTLAYLTDLSQDFESSRIIGILESKFRDAIEYSPIATSVTKDSRILMANLVYIDLFGYDSIEEIRGEHTSIFHGAKSRKIIEEKVKRREEGEFTVETYDAYGLHRNGSEFPIRVTAKRIDFEDGIGILSYIEKRVEEN
ncbi:MAG: hypothetical protein HeimC2_08920 [Candidatus Heimdallarchaeota archaeon LC_2]|nr:MAG: hypothetical protein HeimC2_08920 [Candidatus Heimdallarchaeota archaeon LC_2]